MKRNIKAALLKTIAELQEIKAGATRQGIWMRVDRIEGVRDAAESLVFGKCLSFAAFKEISAAVIAAVDQLNQAAANAQNAA